MHKTHCNLLEGGTRLARKQPVRPLITIITVVRNGEKEIGATLDSVVSQTFQDYELIVIDGASTDATVEYLKILNNKIDYWISESDSGIYDAMNKGLRAARGEWVYFLNSGDALASADVLKNISIEIKRSNKEIVVAYVNVIEDGEKIGRFPIDTINLNSARFLFESRLCHQALFIRKRAYDEVRGFDPRFPTFADFFACFKIVCKSGYDRAEIEIANFPINGASSDYRKSVQLYREREMIFAECGESRSKIGYLFGLGRACLYRYKRTILRKI